MRKLFFALLAVVLMLGSGFSNINGHETNDYQNCTYSIARTYIDARGVPQLEVKTFSIEVQNDLECIYRQIDHVWDLRLGERIW